MDWQAIIPTSIPVLVPRRDDHGPRDTAWARLQNHVWRFARVIEGHHHDGPFNRAAALNTAAAAADDDRTWNLAVIADADSFAPPQQLAGAITLAQTTGRVVIAHSRWVNVELDETDQILDAGYLEHRDTRMAFTFTVSSMLVVPRAAWDTVNGFDERFQGWGREDNAFMRAIKVLHQPPLRIDGTVYHLEHARPAEDTDRRRSPLYTANERRWQQYLAARTPDTMRELVAGNHAAVPA